MYNKHKSVLLDECISYLNLKEDSVIVDCTLGYAGHSSEILKRINKGKLFAFDQDTEAILSSTKRLNEIGNNYEIINSNFVNIKNELNKRGITKVDSILYDLGVSSPQLDEDYRGFSFHKDAKLDMRMDTSKDFSAYNVVNEYTYNELVRVIRDYGEEKYASSIAKNIVKRREIKKIETTLELVDIIRESMPVKATMGSHPARRTFQAIRIEVNNELEVLKLALESALDMLKVGGRISVITFHSLEDRIVKEMFRKYSEVDKNLSKLPFVPEEYLPKYKVIANITPSHEELEENNRSRSSRLRVIEKIKD